MDESTPGTIRLPSPDGGVMLSYPDSYLETGILADPRWWVNATRTSPGLEFIFELPSPN